MMPVSARKTAGFSLVEVLVAMALLAGVLVSIAGLFAFGGRQVRSGRSSTEALAVARDVLEELNGWGFDQTYSLFGDDGGASSLRVSSDPTSPDYHSALDKWQALLDQRLEAGLLDLRIDSLTDGGPAPPLATSRALRIRVEIRWRDGLRDRHVELVTVRM